MITNLLITGANGQLGNELRQLVTSYPNFHFIFTDVETLDICDKEALNEFLIEQPVQFIVNCAAYTAVDKAEEDAERCYAINRDAVRNLAEAAATHGSKMIHISTDYVFSGKAFRPYTEEMPLSPDTIYGKSKAEGEQAMLDHCPESIILRTSWLYSSFGNNFVKTMIKLGREKEILKVVYDQIGTPTYAADLASAILEIIRQSIEHPDYFKPGIYHYSNEGICSWYDFAVTIHRLAHIQCRVQPVPSEAYPAKAPRPFYSVLSKQKFKDTFHLSIAHWETSLEKCIPLIMNEID
ncbi:MAG: dTDP-4-dehydrorhamnose reductase [Microbacter sp.]